MFKYAVDYATLPIVFGPWTLDLFEKIVAMFEHVERSCKINVQDISFIELLPGMIVKASIFDINKAETSLKSTEIMFTIRFWQLKFTKKKVEGFNSIVYILFL